MANSYLNRTTGGSATGATTWTYSVWLKRSKLGGGSAQKILAAGSSSSDRTEINLGGSDTLDIYRNISGSEVNLSSTRKFRDTNGWYNFCIQNNNGTVTVYCNGETVAMSSATLGTNKINNTSTVHYIGQQVAGGQYFEGYMSHAALVDGSVVAPTVFGETDSTSGIWKFKSPSGVTWGTNGFHLKFENSGALGTDSSGNTNTFTVNGNLKQALDTPSNVYATLNPLQMIQTNAGTLSEGNLKLVSNGSDWTTLISTIAAYNGKYYAECKATSISASDFGGFGIVSANQHSLASLIGTSTVALGVGYQSNGGRYENGNLTSSYFATFTTGDILALALDLDNETLQFYKNGSTTGSQIDISSMIATSNYPIHIGCSGHTNSTLAMNFGNGYFGTTAISSAGSNGNGSLFEYDVPSGFYALNTKNINTYG